MLTEVISGLIGGAAAGFVGGSVAGYFGGWQFAHNLELLKRRVDALWGAENSEKGVAAREMQAARTQQAMGEAAMILKAEGTQDEKNKKLMELAMRYPDIAMKLASKVGLKL